MKIFLWILSCAICFHFGIMYNRRQMYFKTIRKDVLARKDQIDKKMDSILKVTKND